MRISHGAKKNTNGLPVALSLVVAACAQAQSCTPVVEFSHEENATGFINKGITDAEIAVGESQILVCSNTNLVLHDKTGATISGQRAALGDYPSASDPFFVHDSGSGGVIGDPVVLYDYHSERFWVLADDALIALGPTPLYSHYQFAVSVGSSTAIAGSDQWIYFDEEIYETDINTPPYRIVHNQMIAVDQEAFYSVGLHESQDEPGGDRVKTTLIHVWDKSDLLLGTQPTPTILDLPNVYGDETWGHAPAVEYSHWDNDHPMYVVAPGNKPNSPNAVHQDTIRIGAIISDGLGGYSYDYFDLSDDVTDWFDVTTTVTVPTSCPPPTQPPFTQTMHVIAGRFLHAAYIPGEDSGRIWCALHVRASDGQIPPAATGPTIIRWYEIETNGWPYVTNAEPMLIQEGEISGGGYDYYDPAIAVDAIGNMGLVWTRSSTTSCPEFWMGYRATTTTTPGVLTASAMKQASTIVRSGQKADYAGCDPDPSETCKFWGHSPLGKSSTEWETYVASICVSSGPCTTTDSLSQPADYNCDGVSDTLDALIFADLIAKGSKAADLNGSGTIDAGDVKEFEARMEKGQKK